ncbi:MAG: hypothetical protein ABIH42_09440 [Planctomycetota bacterium]
MGLANIIQRAAQTAFKAIGDIPLICTYTSKGTPVYVPATGAYTSTDTDYTSLSVLFEDYTAKEITDAGGVILSTDQKASIPNLSLTPTPKITDYITDSNSQKWTVQNIKIDPARALYVFQVRRSA